MRIARVAVFACACALFAVLLSPVDAATKPPRPVGVDWGGYHFTGQHSLKSWLARRGATYGIWARRHPNAVYLLTHPAPPPIPKRPVVKTETSTTTARLTPATSSPARTAARRADNGNFSIIVKALVALAFLSLAVAVAPATLTRPVFGDATTTTRTVGLGVAGAVALGIAIAYTL